MTVTIKKSAITVPPSVRRLAGLKIGQRIEFKVSGKTIRIVPQLPADEDTPAQRRSLDMRLAKSEKDIRAGRVFGPFESAEEMAASIEAGIAQSRQPKRRAKPLR